MTHTAVAVFAYRRPVHLARVLRALRVQLKVTPLPVHLFLDGPRGDDDLPAVQGCRNVAEQAARGLELQLHAATVNRGLYSALTEGVWAVLERHPRLIVLEDDILTSRHFLRYMLDGLDVYADEPRAAAIHGYTPPIPAELPDTFFLGGADCWGWATWRDRWNLFRSDAAAMAAEIRERGLADDFDLGGRVPNLQLLDARAAGRSGSWAICWHASCFLADRYTLHPGRSLVRNIGLDHSGEHCVPSANLEAVLTQRPLHVQRQSVEENPLIVEAFSRQIAPPALPLRAMRRVQRFLRRKLSSGGRVL
ncbi:MAG: glycosyltransferase family 2 protein [Cyanobacteriota bacterium]